jgi:hypothetical protein
MEQCIHDHFRDDQRHFREVRRFRDQNSENLDGRIRKNKEPEERKNGREQIDNVPAIRKDQ